MAAYVLAGGEAAYSFWLLLWIPLDDAVLPSVHPVF